MRPRRFRARAKCLSAESALLLMPHPYKDIRMLLAAMPETEFDRAVSLVFRDVYPNLLRVAAVQGHSIPFAQPERWQHDSKSAPETTWPWNGGVPHC